MSTFSPEFWAPGLEISARRRPQLSRSNTNRSTNSNLSNLKISTTSNQDTLPFPEPPVDGEGLRNYCESPVSQDAADHKGESVGTKKGNILSRFFHKFENNHTSTWDCDEEDPFGSGDEAPARNSVDGDHKDRKRKVSMRRRKGDAEPETSLVLSNGVTVVSLRKKYGLVCSEDNPDVGIGATAVVRLAYKLGYKDEKDRQLFAIKEFRKRRKEESDREYIKKLTGEFCISSTLHHPNVVETVDLVYDENRQWCTEYCGGGDLYNVIKNGHMEKSEINCCFRQLLQGVDYLHSLGVAHRDLKPENLLLTTSGRLKITDFGVSDVFQVCWERDMHASRGRCGSEPYMAPELFEKQDYDARLVDLWSCGVVYYAMAFKGVMFHRARKDDPYFVAYLEKRNLGTYEPFLSLEPGCRELLEGLLEPTASLRWTMEKVMSSDWLKSVAVCENCFTPDGKEHIHFTEEFYRRRRHELAINALKRQESSIE